MVITYNRINLTRLFIENLLKTAGDSYNLIVLDNNSSDETQDFLKENCVNKFNCNYIDNIIYIQMKENVGVAAGRNFLLKAANTFFKDSKYYMTVDNDIGACQDWLIKAKKVLQVKGIGFCGINVEGINYPTIKTKINWFGIEEDITYQEKPKGQGLGTVAVLGKRQMFDLIGYFDSIIGYGHEDGLYAFRALKACPHKVGFIEEMGLDFSPPEIENRDYKEYREYKNKLFKENKKVFFELYNKYNSGQKSLYVPFKEDVTPYIIFKG